MAGKTKKKYERVQDMAMEIVFDYSIEKLDKVSAENATLGKQIRRGFAAQVAAEHSVTFLTAQQHISKASRRQRWPEWKPPAEWGGKRKGAGAKTKE